MLWGCFSAKGPGRLIRVKERMNGVMYRYKLNVGFITRVRLNHLLDAGDITAQKVELFHTAALNFFVKAVEYALQRLPLSIPTFFCLPQDHDSVEGEFLDYQTMPVPILEADPDIEGFWANMASLKHKVTGVGRFDRLSTVAKLVLVLPHSNADAERVLSVAAEQRDGVRTEEAKGYARGFPAPCLPLLQPIGGLGRALAGRFNPLRALQPKRRLQQLLAPSPAPVSAAAAGSGGAAAGASAPVAIPVPPA
ncbi:hypothetical protein JOQ06_007670 [Pogonophryne albipinna]|uniref:Uncharacterized protein n=1 Tax=Pogonophryne albipinna TaxID=1090488 RepID=A0AAD6B0C9_9TELE|nr:hypothetical protein JOQ06_007670 [Pogonophryne albipinna]